MPESGKNVCVCTYFFTFHRRRECLNLKCKKKLCRFVFTLGPNEVSFITHSMVNSIVKTRLQSARTSMYSSGAPWNCGKIRKMLCMWNVWKRLQTPRFLCRNDNKFTLNSFVIWSYIIVWKYKLGIWAINSYTIIMIGKFIDL